MDGKINSGERNVRATDAGLCCRKLFKLDDLKHGDNRTAVRPIRHHGLRETGKKRGQSKKSLKKTSVYVLPLRPLLRADMSLWLGAGHLDPFMKFPVCVGSTERELLHLGTYRITGISDTRD
jgi:hypothetical protein